MNATSHDADDALLLKAAPEYLFVSDMLKATPKIEGGERFIYLEASNEALDQQNEVVMSKALEDSAAYFLKFGNLDLDHYTIIGAKLEIPNYLAYEIGRPVDVRFDKGRTFVKGRIFSGSGPMAAKANEFWSSLVDLNPPQRWYPSVGGKVIDKVVEFDAKTQQRRAMVKAVRWYNIGFSKTPVNANVPEVETMPLAVFAKSWTAAGLDHLFVKTLTAGYGTDSAQLSGGSAFRLQSLDGSPVDYWDLRDRLAQELRSGKCGANPGLSDLVEHASKTYGLDEDVASQFIERFARDIRDGIKKASKPH